MMDLNEFQKETIYQLALEAGHIGIWERDLLTDQLIWSDQQYRIFGLDPARGVPTYEEFRKLIHPADRSYLYEKDREAIQNRGVFEVEFRAIWPDGSIHWIQARAKVLSDGQNRPVRMVGANVDITSKKKIESERLKLLARERAARHSSERAVRRLHDLQNITETALSRFTNMDYLLRDVVNYVKQSLRGDFVAIVMLTDDKKNLELKAYNWIAETSNKIYAPVNKGVSGMVYNSGEPVVIDDVHTIEDAEWFRAAGIQCLMAAPLRTVGGIIGVLHVGRMSQNIFSHQDLTFLQLIADRVSTAIHNAKLFDQLRTSLGRLSEEQILRDRVAAALGHDLRTPLATARMSAEVTLQRLASHTLKEGVAENLLRKTVESLKRADDMIQDLLDVHRAKAGKSIPLDIVRVHICDVIRSTLESLSTIYGDRFQFEESGSIEGFWSEQSLRRILENLCSNAVKYGSPIEPVIVKLKTGGKYVSLSVHNKGKKIEADEIAGLFELFYRSSQSPSAKGWGIGLTVVKILTESLGGTIEVTSTDDETVFEVRLPIDSRPVTNGVQ